MTPEDKYPTLMVYIKERSSDDEKTAWNMLRADEAAAAEGSYAEVAQDLEHAQRKVEAVIPITVRWASFLDCPFGAITSRRVAITLPTS